MIQDNEIIKVLGIQRSKIQQQINDAQEILFQTGEVDEEEFGQSQQYQQHIMGMTQFLEQHMLQINQVMTLEEELGEKCQKDRENMTMLENKNVHLQQRIDDMDEYIIR